MTSIRGKVDGLSELGFPDPQKMIASFPSILGYSMDNVRRKIAALRELGIAGVLMSRLLSDARGDRAISRVYGWVDRRNREMQLMLRMMYGFTQVQGVWRASAPRLGWQVPWSDNPKFGPVSRVGRHSTVA